MKTYFWLFFSLIALVSCKGYDDAKQTLETRFEDFNEDFVFLGSVVPFACVAQDLQGIDGAEDIKRVAATTLPELRSIVSSVRPYNDQTQQIKNKLDEIVAFTSQIDNIVALMERAENLQSGESTSFSDLISAFALVSEVQEAKTNMEKATRDIQKTSQELAEAMDAYKADLHYRASGLSKIAEDDDYYLSDNDKENLRKEIGLMMDNTLRRSIKFTEYADKCSAVSEISAALQNGDIDALTEISKKK